MEQTTPIGRSTCPRIFRELIGKSRRFMRTLLTLCLNLMLIPLRSRRISTTQIAWLVVFFSWVFRFLSLRESLIVRLLKRSRWGFRAIIRGPYRSKPDSSRCTSVGTINSLSWRESLSMLYFLAFRRLWIRCGQTSCGYLMMIMRGHSKFCMP
jgi:hypothetical protein